MALRTISICAGVGGLDLGVRIARPDARCVAYVEREASAAASLVASMEAGRLHPAAIWSDLRTFDAAAWRGAVDCILSGDPCQGNSVAGKRLGADDDRWLLDRAIDVYDRSGAAVFFRENVPGNLAGQLAVAIPALERLGCRIACGIFSAAEAGASHRRERLFLLAHRDGAESAAISGDDGEMRGLPEAECEPEHGAAVSGRGGDSASDAMGNPFSSCNSWDASHARRGPAVGTFAERPSCQRLGALVHTPRERRGEGRAEHGVRSGRDAASSAGGALADSCGTELEGQQRGQHHATGRQVKDGHPLLRGRAGLPAFAPGPADPRWPAIIAAAPSLEPAVCGVAHGLAGRIERLRHCGNGVVPLTAALAWVRLHGLLADHAAGDAVRFADHRCACAGDAVVSAAA
jgi:DNA (cytosine-5)-methyltransferase 1